MNATWHVFEITTRDTENSAEPMPESTVAGPMYRKQHVPEIVLVPWPENNNQRKHMSEYCTYRTEFSNGFYYLGKGRTARVESGQYTGSGVRYKLALIHWADSLKIGEITVTTRVLATYPTESEAYAAEELIVPHSLLSDPYCLNMHQGGLKGRYQTPSRLLSQYTRERSRGYRKRSQERVEKIRTEVRELKRALRDSKKNDKSTA